MISFGNISLIAWLLITFATNLPMVYAGRSIQGFCVGLTTLTLPIYLSEILQPEVRGTLGLLPTTIGNIGACAIKHFSIKFHYLNAKIRLISCFVQSFQVYYFVTSSVRVSTGECWLVLEQRFRYPSLFSCISFLIHLGGSFPKVPSQNSHNSMTNSNFLL